MNVESEKLRPIEVAIVIPTFKEHDNVKPMLKLLEAALEGILYEVIFVDDDSPDGTAALVREQSQLDVKVRVLQRVGRRGLASACLEGMMSTAAPYIAVIDADLQHDERILPQMLAKLKAEKLDLVVGTRNAEGGSMGEFSATRVKLSQFGRRLSEWVAKSSLSDPMSGFFMVDRRWLEEVIHLTSAVGFKILLDLVASSPRPVKVGEVPYTFRTRQHGESKLDILVGLEYLQLLLDKVLGHLIPARFVIFSMVGVVGILFALLLFSVLSGMGGLEFAETQVIVTVVVMVLNFFLNNSTTYRDRRLKGGAMYWGLITFMVSCSLGAWINVKIAENLRNQGVIWYLASAAGLVIGAVWNYGVTSITTWKHGRKALEKRSQRVSMS